jgi:hypothetical protein
MAAVGGGDREESEIKYIYTFDFDNFCHVHTLNQERFKAGTKLAQYKVVQHNDEKAMAELEKLISIVSANVHYSRSDILEMPLPNFSALLISLQEKK